MDNQWWNFLGKNLVEDGMTDMEILRSFKV